MWDTEKEKGEESRIEDDFEEPNIVRVIRVPLPTPLGPHMTRGGFRVLVDDSGDDEWVFEWVFE